MAGMRSRTEGVEAAMKLDSSRLWCTFMNHELRVRLGYRVVARIPFEIVDTVSFVRSVLGVLGIHLAAREGPHGILIGYPVQLDDSDLEALDLG